MKTFDQTIKLFLKRIDDLQSYVENILSQFVEEEKDNKLLIPFILASHANRGDDDIRKLSEEEIVDLENKFGRKIEFKEDESSDKNNHSIKKIIWKNAIERQKSYAARKNLLDSLSKSNTHGKYRVMTLEMSFVRLISEVEKFFSELMHCYFEQSPDYLTKGEKSKSTKFSYSDFNELRTQKNVVRRMVELEFINNKGIENWFEYLGKGPFKNLNLSAIEKLKPELIESYQRRNILTHDAGIVNRIYLDKFPNNHPEPRPELDSKIKLTPGYLKKAISNFEICFLIIASEIWKLSPKENQTHRGNTLWMRGYHHLQNDEYKTMILIGDYIAQDNKINDRDKLYTKINTYIAKKSLFGLQGIKEDLSNENIGLQNKLFRMALLTLSEQYDDSVSLIEELLISASKSKIFEEHTINTDEINKKIKSQKNDLSESKKQVQKAMDNENLQIEKLKKLKKELDEETELFDNRLDLKPSLEIDSLKSWPLFKFFREDQQDKYKNLIEKYSKK